MKKKLIIVAFVFALVFAGGVVHATNPVLDFYAGQSGLLVEDDAPRYEYKQPERKEEKSIFSRAYSSIKNFFGFGGSSEERKERESRYGAYGAYGDSSSDSSGNDDEEEEGPKPTMNCRPSTVTSGEPMLIFWQCLDGSDSATLNNDKANADNASGLSDMGSKVVHPSTGVTKYTLNCSAGTSAHCAVDVIDPILDLSASPTSVDKYKTTTLNWTSADMQNCVLNSDDNSSKYASWRRSGTSGSGIHSHPITKTTKFTLTCTTKTRSVKEKEVTITLK